MEDSLKFNPPIYSDSKLSANYTAQKPHPEPENPDPPLKSYELETIISAKTQSMTNLKLELSQVQKKLAFLTSENSKISTHLAAANATISSQQILSDELSASLHSKSIKLRELSESITLSTQEHDFQQKRIASLSTQLHQSTKNNFDLSARLEEVSLTTDSDCAAQIQQIKS